MGSSANSPSDSVSVFGPSMRFKGELHADEDLQILGIVEGSITHTKYLTIASEGRVKASIKGHIIVVEGTVEGDLVGETSVAITQTGHLTGDIRSPSISINDGAKFNGKVAMDPPKPIRVVSHPDLPKFSVGSTDTTTVAKGK
jgi:cytoskeletal protein CcmA (bactofilin family)